MRLLLDHGADPDVVSMGNTTPLMKAVKSCDLDTIQAMIDKGANVNACDTLQRWTVLHHAVVGCGHEVVALLVKSGAKLDAKDRDGRTPLQLAIWASAPQKSEEEQEKELKELMVKDEKAAIKLAAEMIVAKSANNWRRGRDFSKVVAVLQDAGAK